jgi:hypothetical protein
LIQELEIEEKRNREMINGLDVIQDKIVEENNTIDKEIESVQDLMKRNEKEYDNIIKKYEDEIEKKYAEEEDDKPEYEEPALEYYYKQYGLEDIINHDYNNEANTERAKFNQELEKIKEKMEVMEKQLYENES